MADIVNAQGTNIPASMRTRWIELADGTHALVLAAVLMGQRDGGAGAELVELDSITGGVPVISTPHSEVHEGETFRFWYVVPHGSELANDADIDIIFTTTTKTAHVVFKIGLGGNAEFLLFRSPTFDADGAALPIHNLKDGDANATTVSAVLDPTVNTDGTEIDGEFLAGGTGGNAQGGAFRQDTEDIWQVATSYLIRITNRAGSAKMFSVLGQWYEE